MIGWEKVDLAVQRQEGRQSAVGEAKAIAGVRLSSPQQQLRAELKALCVQLRRGVIGSEDKSEIKKSVRNCFFILRPSETLTQRDDPALDAMDGLGTAAYRQPILAMSLGTRNGGMERLGERLAAQGRQIAPAVPVISVAAFANRAAQGSPWTPRAE